MPSNRAYTCFRRSPTCWWLVPRPLLQCRPTVTGWLLGVSRAHCLHLWPCLPLSPWVSLCETCSSPGSSWSVPAVATVGLALTPGLHSMGASVTASTWALGRREESPARPRLGPCGVTGHSAPPLRSWSARRLRRWRPAPAPIPCCCSSRWPCLSHASRSGLRRRSATERGCGGCDSGQRLVDGAKCLGNRRPTRCRTCT